jgi:SulP family sulfate permease
MLLMAPLASYLALPCLAAVLLSVSWRLIDYREVSSFLARAPFDDRLVLLATLILTVVVDLNVAIGVGFGLACMLFMHRMSEAAVAGIGPSASLDDDLDDVARPRSVLTAMELPEGVQVLSLRGPLFFGGASAVADALKTGSAHPKVLILRMRDVPLIDATALSALEDMIIDLDKHGGRLVISGLQKQPRDALHRMGLLKRHRVILASNGFIALEKAKGLLETTKG